VALHDVHAHLTDPRLAEQLPAVLERARAAGVGTIVCNGLHPADNERVRAMAAANPEVRPAFGLYPVDAVLPEMLAAGVPYERPDTEVQPAEEAVAWVAAHVDEAVAVGEIGLDRYWVPESLWERQEQVFRALVRLAIAREKPIIVHSRKAEERMLEVLLEERAPRVDWHCFGGKVKLGLRIGAQPGHYLSIPANARRNESFTRLLRDLPRDKVLLETDCPYLGPDKGVWNEPANVARTAAYAGELWGWPAEEVEAQLARNFGALFGFAP
jgi:TatD DNase family protein